MVTLLRTTWAPLVVVVATIVIMGTGIVVSLFIGGTAPAIRYFYTSLARCAPFGFRSKPVVAGVEHPSTNGRYVVVSNHESHLEVPAPILALRDHPLRFVARRELGPTSIFGAGLRRSGTVLLTRSDARTDLDRLDGAQAELAQRASVLSFAQRASVTEELRGVVGKEIDRARQLAGR